MKHKTISKRLLLFLALAFTLALGKSTRTQAASDTLYGWFTQAPYWGTTAVTPSKTATIQVEAGKSFQLSNFFVEIIKAGYIGGWDTHISGSTLKLSFTSSKPSVATVSKSTGKVVAKKKGTTVITCKYKKKSYTCTLKVLKKGAFGSKYSKLNKAAEALTKYDGKKLTSKNIVAAIKCDIAYAKATKASVTDFGFSQSSDTVSTKLVVPSCVSAENASNAISDYVRNNNPLRTGKLKPTSASGKAGSSKITVKLNKAPTATQMAMLQLDAAQNPSRAETGKQVSFGIAIENTDYCGDELDEWQNELGCYGTMTLTTGSKTATITLSKQYSTGKRPTLIKDYEYTITSSDYFKNEIVFVAK